MAAGRIIVQPGRFNLVLHRLANQIIENYDDFEDACIVGIQEKGVTLSKHLIEIIKSEIPAKAEILFGKLDISFYRDDYRLREKPIKVSPTELDFSLDGKRVLLVDDVLYSGRTIQAALSALQDFGRPSKVDLLVMVDRRFNRELPIHPDYVGVTIDAVDEAYVRVSWDDIKDNHKVQIFSADKEKI